MDGILNIYKEKGFTSHDVVAVVRRTIGQKKVGHTGTLDPDAEGVLPVCLGKGTKLADMIMAKTKGYRAILKLGVTTTTEDASGEVLEVKGVNFDEKKIKEVIASFVGEINQIPPMYSAIKVNGKKLYELAREGKEIERKSRVITIFEISIRQFLPPDRIEIDVMCSKGTYIRTLCSDIGQALGCGGHMEHLLRTASGQFTLETAIKLDTLKKLAEEERISEVLLPIDQVLEGYPTITIAEKGTNLLHNGAKIYDYFFAKKEGNPVVSEKVLVYDSENTLMGIYQLLEEEGKHFVKPLKMLR